MLNATIGDLTSITVAPRLATNSNGPSSGRQASFVIFSGKDSYSPRRMGTGVNGHVNPFKPFNRFLRQTFGALKHLIRFTTVCKDRPVVILV